MNPILAGMLIFAKYDPEFEVAAHHDQIWIGPRSIEVSEEDAQELKRLNWFKDDGNDDTWSHLT